MHLFGPFTKLALNPQTASLSWNRAVGQATTASPSRKLSRMRKFWGAENDVSHEYRKVGHPEKNIQEKIVEYLDTFKPIPHEISALPDNHKGAYSSFTGSPISQGIFQFDMWNVKPSEMWDWDNLRDKIKSSVGNYLLFGNEYMINSDPKKKRFDKRSSVTDWEKNNTLDC